MINHEQEAFLALREQNRKPIPYPLTEQEKREYNYADYEQKQDSLYEALSANDFNNKD